MQWCKFGMGPIETDADGQLRQQHVLLREVELCLQSTGLTVKTSPAIVKGPESADEDLR
jgi:hypothetical protein